MYYGKKIVVDPNGNKSVIVDDGHGNIVYKSISEYNEFVKRGMATPPLKELPEGDDPQWQMN